MKLGTAYQIYDDCLDLVGLEEIVGKTLGTDLAKGKLTLPILNLLESVSENQRDVINKRILDELEIDLPALVGTAQYQAALESAVGTALDLLEGCRADLGVLSASEYKDALVQITRFLETLLSKCRN
jgi:octaprenyl-diphosphate synthase